MVRDFRAFVLRGNVVDLAVGIIIGGAFGAVVAALVKDLITPLLAALGGQPDFSSLQFTVNRSRFLYGDFVNAVISFLIVAAVVFLLVVKPVNSLMERQKRGEVATDPASRPCPECLSQIPVGARRCAQCTSPVAIRG